jgi:hypothetical protein
MFHVKQSMPAGQARVSRETFCGRGVSTALQVHQPPAPAANVSRETLVLDCKVKTVLNGMVLDDVSGLFS